jgi:6-phosphogluconolactonase/glucosamine-6-phosphate isomerase/deaminase
MSTLWSGFENMPRSLDVSVQPCRQTVSRQAAEMVREVAGNATKEEPALLLLSGGSSVLDVCGELASMTIPWHALHVGQLDERVAARSHPERAWPNIESSFLARIPAEVAGRYPIPVDHLDAEAAAASYDDTMGRLAERVRSIVAVCGLGADGHVASLLAGDEKTARHSRVLTTGPYSGLRRITVSMAFLQKLPSIVVVASGESKAATMQRLILSPQDMPAACLPSHTRFVIDRQAAALMYQSPCHE